MQRLMIELRDFHRKPFSLRRAIALAIHACLGCSDAVIGGRPVRVHFEAVVGQGGALPFSGEVPLVVIEASTAFVIVVALVRSVPAPQGSHFHCGSHPGDQVSDLHLPCSRALLNRNQPTGMNRYSTDSDFER
jgi:hypothetical protein